MKELWTLEVIVTWCGHSQFFLFDSEGNARAKAQEIKSKLTNWGDVRVITRKVKLGEDVLGLPYVVL